MTFNKLQSLRKLSAALSAASLLIAVPALAGNRDGFRPEELPLSPKQERPVSTKQQQPEQESPLALAMQERHASAMEQQVSLLDQGSGGSGNVTSNSERFQENDPFDRGTDAGG